MIATRDAIDLLATLPVDAPVRFGAWLRNRSTAIGLSQRRLGELSGVDHSTISRLMAGAGREPSLDIALRLARGLRLAERER